MVAQELMLMEPKLIHRVILAGTGPRGGKGIEDVTKISDRALLKALVTFKDIKTYLFFTTTQQGKRQCKGIFVAVKNSTE